MTNRGSPSGSGFLTALLPRAALADSLALGYYVSAFQAVDRFKFHVYGDSFPVCVIADQGSGEARGGFLTGSGFVADREPRVALASSLLGYYISVFQAERPRAVRPPEFALGTAEFGRFVKIRRVGAASQALLRKKDLFRHEILPRPRWCGSQPQSGRARPHSMTLARFRTRRTRRPLLECGRALPLWKLETQSSRDPSDGFKTNHFHSFSTRKMTA